MADRLINLEIVTPEKVIYRGTARAVTVPGTVGSFQILYNHAPIISTLETGAIKVIDENGSEIYYVVTGGFVEVKDNNVAVLADSAEKVEKENVREVIKKKIKGLKNVTG